MTCHDPAARILVFSKAPVPGQVKTRLLPALSATAAAELHARLLWQTVTMALACQLAPVQLWCSPDCGHPLFRRLARQGAKLHLQQGADLGQRLQHASSTTLKNRARVILIGTDCPGLDAALLQQALDRLAEHDVVLGPAEDGGYYLLGLRQPAPELFQDIDWGSDRVLAQTRRSAAMQQLGVFELPQRWDLDRPADLRRWQAMQQAEAPAPE